MVIMNQTKENVFFAAQLPRRRLPRRHRPRRHQPQRHRRHRPRRLRPQQLPLQRRRLGNVALFFAILEV